MARQEESKVPRAVRSVYPPLLLIGLAAAYVWWSQDYRAGPRLVPVIVGIGTMVLAAIDLVSRLDLPAAGAIRAYLGADFRNREMQHDPGLWDELAQFGWIAGCVATMLAIGFLPAVPLFVFLYMRVHGRLPLRICLIGAASVFVFVAVVFEFLLDYALYRGVLFDSDGFDSW